MRVVYVMEVEMTRRIRDYKCSDSCHRGHRGRGTLVLSASQSDSV